MAEGAWGEPVVQHRWETVSFKVDDMDDFEEATQVEVCTRRSNLHSLALTVLLE